jgi:small subunit ribosomal protein S1
MTTTQPQTQEFSWEDEFDYSDQQRAQMAAMYERTMMKVAEKDIIRGTVVTITPREVIVNVGFKSEGIIPLTEFRDTPDLKPGDPIEVYLETIEDKSGQMILSRRTANNMRTWEKINQALEADAVVEGIVKRRTKGGFVVDVEGIEAFLPGSQIDVKPIRDYDAYVGQKMEFKVVKINHAQHNVVISHKALIEKDIEKQKAEIIGNLQKGQVLEGTVKNITSFGVFIDLGGVDGLLHITDISWGRISSPDEVLKLDQKLNVVVLDFDDEKKRISLGLKQLEAHPWEKIGETIKVGQKVKGRIVTIADYGVFVEVMPGVEGLIHVSEMSWSQHPKNPGEMFQVGQEIDAVVLTMDMEERKMSLGLKQLTEDPWAKAAEKYPVGSRHTGTVRNITNYGLFVEMEEGIDGFIHVQDLSWNKKINHPSDFTKKDEKLEVVVLELDVENRKLRLGHKQLTEDPWETFESIFPVDSIHDGTITKMLEKGALVEMQYGIEAFCPIKQLKEAPGVPALKEGDTAKFRVIEFNKDTKKIVVSHSRTWQEGAVAEEGEKKPAAAKPKKKPAKDGAPAEKDTLGDNAALAGLKAAMGEGAAKKSKKTEGEE